MLNVCASLQGQGPKAIYNVLDKLGFYKYQIVGVYL